MRVQSPECGRSKVREICTLVQATFFFGLVNLENQPWKPEKLQTLKLVSGLVYLVVIPTVIWRKFKTLRRTCILCLLLPDSNIDSWRNRGYSSIYTCASQHPASSKNSLEL